MLRAMLRRATALGRGERCVECPDDLVSIALATDVHDVALSLGAASESNARHQALHRSTLADFATVAHRAGIAWFVLNGLPQAELLYADAALRAAGHIDVLLPAGTTSAVQQVFSQEGWKAARIVRGNARALGAAGLRSDPAYLVLAPETGARVHLHERLFFGGGRVGSVLQAELAIRPRRSITAQDVPALQLSTPLVIDILLRGNRRRWSRLKWLVDLDLTLRRLDPGDHAALLDAIEAIGIAPLANAAFSTLRSLADRPVPPAIDQWLAAQPRSAEADCRYRLCVDALATAQPLVPAHEDQQLEPLRFTALRAARDRVRRSDSYRAARTCYRVARSVISSLAATPGQHQRHPATRPDRYPAEFGFAARHFGPNARLDILSFGCSTGDEVFTLRDYFVQARIKGIEVDPGRVAICRARLGTVADRGLAFACADSTADEPDRHYDLIFAMAVFRNAQLDSPAERRATGYLNFAQFERHIVDLVRALKPGGMMFVGASNFRVRDTVVDPQLEVVFHADPSRSGIVPSLFGRDDKRMPGIDEYAVGFRKLALPPGIV